MLRETVGIKNHTLGKKEKAQVSTYGRTWRKDIALCWRTLLRIKMVNSREPNQDGQ